MSTHSHTDSRSAGGRRGARFARDTPNRHLNSPTIAGAPTKRQRPAVLRGTTRKVASPLGDVFVTINEDAAGIPFELFATLGRAGSAAMAETEALGRMISLALRFGIPINEIHHQLRGISSEAASGVGPDKALSLPDAIARAIALRQPDSGCPAFGAPMIDAPADACPECKREAGRAPASW